ncbi:saccharopine dehydrogenase NADP-binding domain-containing protein [Streptomyces sp. ACA25]|uniref:saccharopine dehydrogenase family protein n=1 Tax=Streptomyces sp. ACA25 TaxID=3022596 RepID=UPI00230818E1|nr:saccharopine dehydrogenase NADP-binding domain-containing protein [Streptomyces sp. ACA25]MDB1089757.1 saccharopine dehydrogenase NADP-binding domain-containing protein [Streptomyces sp. ACA25]
MPRNHDIVLFGATGFAGALAAEYLARHAPQDCRWALAGRDTGKLAGLRDRLARIDPRCRELPLLAADAGDPASLRTLAGSTRVLASTVGPYIRYGTPLVAACAAAGTDYLDITGEPEFVDLMYLRHHEQAVRTGARLVHACGFDSVPHDLGVRYTVGLLPEGVPLRIDGYVRASGGLSGGTLASALTAFSRASRTARTAKERRRADPPPGDRSVRTEPGRLHRNAGLGVWGVPLPTLDPQIVGRSAAALDRYGPDFHYSHFAAVRGLPVALGGIAGAGVLFALAQHPATRRMAGSRLAPGTGPDQERRARSRFSVRFTGEGGGHRVLTEVAGGDPGYEETAKMLAESALCLAFDELPATSGQVTTAVAMGERLSDRLRQAGITFRVLAAS